MNQFQRQKGRKRQVRFSRGIVRKKRELSYCALILLCFCKIYLGSEVTMAGYIVIDTY